MNECKRTLVALGLYILVFFVSWIILYFASPQFVKYHTNDTGCNEDKSDPFRCLIYSLIFALIIIIVYYLFETKFWQ